MCRSTLATSSETSPSKVNFIASAHVQEQFGRKADQDDARYAPEPVIPSLRHETGSEHMRQRRIGTEGQDG